MYIRHHTHCSVERGRGHFLRCSETWYSKTPTDQYITYNIKNGAVKKRVSSSENQPCWTWPVTFSSPPDPPRKTIHNLPKTPPPQDLLITNALTRVIFPGQPPSTDQLHGPHRGFVPGTNKRPRVCAVKNTHLKPPLPVRGKRPKHFPHQMQPDVCPCNGPGLPDHPPQSGGQPDHLPLLPHIDVKRPTRITFDVTVVSGRTHSSCCLVISGSFFSTSFSAVEMILLQSFSQLL